MNNNLLLDGKIVILCGDFRQILPVLSRPNQRELINVTIKNSLLWN